jgi:hypothetical protein
MMPLVLAGIDTIATDDDIGAVWTEQSGDFVLDPIKIQLGGILDASARISLGHVQRQMFSFNPQQVAVAAPQIEAGTVELTLHDLGGVDLAVKQFARAQNLSPDDARQALIETIKTNSADTVTANPAAAVIVDALVSLVEKSGATLTLKLTPRGRIPAILLIQQFKADPARLLAQFQIEASTRQ